jgi:hypothetical protein
MSVGGVWIFLYNAILDLTVKEPADSTLFLLGVAHWTILCYFGLALYVFYHTGIAVRTKNLERPIAKSDLPSLALMNPRTRAASVTGHVSSKIPSAI